MSARSPTQAPPAPDSHARAKRLARQPANALPYPKLQQGRSLAAALFDGHLKARGIPVSHAAEDLGVAWKKVQQMRTGECELGLGTVILMHPSLARPLLLKALRLVDARTSSAEAADVDQLVDLLLDAGIANEGQGR